RGDAVPDGAARQCAGGIDAARRQLGTGPQRQVGGGGADVLADAPPADDDAGEGIEGSGFLHDLQMMPFHERMKRTQLAATKAAASSRPVGFPPGRAGFAAGTKPLFRSAVTTGLYSKKVREAFSPPLSRLKGRKAGSSSSTTASRG